MSVLDSIGKTPMVEVKAVNPNPWVRLLVKLEGSNPAGSVKDRIARHMIEKAIAEGNLIPGKTILEADLRHRFGLNAVAIVRGQETIVEISPDLRLMKDDYLAVVGSKENVMKFEKFVAS